MEKKYVIKFTLRTNGENWYLINTKGEVVKVLSNSEVEKLLN